MAKSTEALIEDVRTRVRRLLYDDVIEQTIVVMRELSAALSQLASLTADRAALTDAQKDTLVRAAREMFAGIKSMNDDLAAPAKL